MLPDALAVLLAAFLAASTAVAGAVLAAADAALPGSCESPIAAEVAKWPGARSAAITINYDDGSVQGEIHDEIRSIVEELGFRIDYELVTGDLADRPWKRDFIEQELLPRGYDFFGHGREHVSHDERGGAWSLASAEYTRDVLIAMGIRPVGFAYPQGAGYTPEVQQAIRDAGFLSARLFAGSDVFIVPGEQRTPENWYALPTIRMESIDFNGNEALVNNTAELTPFLDRNVQLGSWLILTYHAIGQPEGWGFYELADFASDMRAVAERDLWVGSLNEATLYVYEYETAVVETAVTAGSTCDPETVTLSVEDGRDDDRFDLPLSIVVDLPPSWVGATAQLGCRGMASTTVDITEARMVLDMVPNGEPCELSVPGA